MKNNTNWNERAKNYNSINWVTDRKLLGVLVDALKLTGKEKVLEAGAGTGKISKEIKSKVKSIIAMDSNIKMLELIKDDSIIIEEGDVREMPFKDKTFDRVIFRNVLHHCAGYVSQVIDEALRVLKKGGMILVSEGVPISNDCVSDFAQIVTIKENRLIFTDEDIGRLLYKFKEICEYPVMLEQQSVDNWLDNCIEDIGMKAKIKLIHHQTSDLYKQCARMQDSNGDILVDMHVMIATGVK